MDYFKKYIKYKNKYLIYKQQISEQIAGNNIPDNLIKELNDEQIENMKKLKENGIDNYNSYKAAKNLNTDKINNFMFNFKKLNELDSNIYEKYINYYYTYEGAKDFDDKQFDNMIILIKHNIEDKYCYDGAKILTDIQIKNMIKLKKSGIDDKYCYDGARDLNDNQIQNMIELKKSGIDDKYCYDWAINLSDIQIQNMIELKKSGISDYCCFKLAKKFKKKLTDKEINNKESIKKSIMKYC